MNEVIVWSPGVTLEQIEKEVVLKAFRHYRGNKTTTANALGISIRTLDDRLATYERQGKERQLTEDAEKAKREAFLERSRGVVHTNPLTGTSVLTRPGDKAPEVAKSISNAKEDMPQPKKKGAK